MNGSPTPAPVTDATALLLVQAINALSAQVAALSASLSAAKQIEIKNIVQTKGV